MDNVLFFEIAATVFFALLFFIDLLKKQLPTRRTILFQLFLCVMMISAVLSVDIELAKRFSESLFIAGAVQTIALLLEVTGCVLLHMYILSTVYKVGAHIVTSLLFGVIPNTILLVLILFSPFTKIAFWFDRAGEMHRTGWFVVGGLIIAGNLCIDLVAIWVFNKRESQRQKILYTLFVAIFILAVMMNIFRVPNYTLWHVGILFFIYIFYLSQQSPDFYVDQSTGYFNRNGFEDVLYERIQYKIPTSCLLIRVAKYDSMDQVYSAELLQKIQIEIGNVIKQNCGRGVVYHISSSTYAVILRSRSDVEVLYYRVREKLNHTWNIDHTLVNHDYCFYEVTYPEYGKDYDDILQKIHYARSDHEIHHKMGDLVHLKQELVQEATERQEVSHLIEEAIMDNTLEIHFQPIFSFERGTISSLEVLARLKNRKREYVDPEYFIRVAEENHTIVELGLQVFRKACMFASKNRIFEKGIENISINLSPAQCRYEHLTEELVEIASQYQVPMERIHLEITESEVVDQKAVVETLHQIRETGAKVALDDFGTGFSTLSNIMDLPVDFVKIDKSLVWSFAEGKNQFLVDLMPMIKAEGKQIVAEGIESAEHIDIIKKLQGDYLQGYYYSKPLNEEEVIRYVTKFNFSEDGDGEGEIQDEQAELMAAQAAIPDR